NHPKRCLHPKRHFEMETMEIDSGKTGPFQAGFGDAKYALALRRHHGSGAQEKGERRRAFQVGRPEEKYQKGPALRPHRINARLTEKELSLPFLRNSPLGTILNLHYGIEWTKSGSLL